MTNRYATKVTEIWSDHNRYLSYFEASKNLMRLAQHKEYITRSELKSIESVKYDYDKIQELEKTFKHDVIAVVEYLRQESGCNKVHLGVTSSDIVDSAMVDLFNQSQLELIRQLNSLNLAFTSAMLRHRDRICIARTHGQVAEPITWEWRLKVYRDQINTSSKKSRSLIMNMRKKLSGPSGSYSFWTPEDEQKWTLFPNSHLTTQVICRSNFCRITSEIAILASIFEKIATDFRLYSLLGSYKESFLDNQRGSSSMPHKMNPVSLERICGLSRKIRANAAQDLCSIPTWLERDISHSSNERLSWSETWSLIVFITKEMQTVITNLDMPEEEIPKEAWTSRILNSEKMQDHDAYTMIQESKEDPSILDKFIVEKGFNKEFIRTHIRNVLNGIQAGEEA